jgi:hypothetical protein
MISKPVKDKEDFILNSTKMELECSQEIKEILMNYKKATGDDAWKKSV